MSQVTFKCPVCLDNRKIKEAVHLGTCGHVLCNPCKEKLVKNVNVFIEKAGVTIKENTEGIVRTKAIICPLCMKKSVQMRPIYIEISSNEEDLGHQ